MRWCHRVGMVGARRSTRRAMPRLWAVRLLCWVWGWQSGVYAQPAVDFVPPGLALPPPATPLAGTVLPPPGAALPPGQFALPPGFAYPPGYVNPVPPGLPNSVAQQMLSQQIQDMSNNITSQLQQRFSFCISNG